ncbi:MAG: cation diffusion facilitator family transporter [Flavobacteriales bacterium]
MGSDHQHHHRHDNLRTAFFLNLGFTVIEIVGGLYVNSVSIISDAVHDLGDSISIGLAWYLERVSKKGASQKFSFGYSRFSLLGALINSMVLIMGSGYVIYEGVRRLIHPELSDANGMMLLAVVGVAVNGYAALKMSRGKTLNERVISWHLLEDVFGWAAVLLVGIVLKFYESPYLDPALSLMIAGYILWNVLKRLKETLEVFLQGTPHEVDLREIEQKLLNLTLIDSLHDSHIWSLDGERNVFSTHVKLREVLSIPQMREVKNQIKETLRPYHFHNCTVELEFADEVCSMEHTH